MRYTLATLRTSRIPQMVNISGTSQRFADICNEAVERLISRGNWLGTAGRYVLAVNASQIVTLPPGLASLERVAVNADPVPIRSGYFEFLGSGGGPRSDSTSYAECLRIAGLFPTSVDITAGSKVRVTCDSASDSGKEIRVYGTDTDGNEIRSLQSGSVLPGEIIALTQAGTESVFTYNTITGVIAPSTLNYGWWMYGVKSGVATLLSSYLAAETHPGYTRYRIGNISTGTETVEAMGRSAYVPMKNENDFCQISNLAAMKYAVGAVVASEQHDHAREELLMNMAIRELDLQLSHYNGAEIPAIEIMGSSVGSHDPVQSMIDT